MAIIAQINNFKLDDVDVDASPRKNSFKRLTL